MLQSQPKLTVVDGRPTTTSFDVARYFDRNHKNVIRAIETTLQFVSDGFNALNFERVTRSKLSDQIPYFYRMTGSGFAMTALGFTGEKAIRLREAYITRFDEMESELRRLKNLQFAQQQIFGFDGIPVLRESLLVSHCVLFLHQQGLLLEMTVPRMTKMVKDGKLDGKFIPRQSIVYKDSVRRYLQSLGIAPKGVFAEGGQTDAE